MTPDISIVVPFYNEEQNVADLHRAVLAGLEGTGYSYECVYVDDGSSDGTRDVLCELAARDRHVRVVALRRNFGQTPAMSAGIAHTRGRIVVTMDGDLQNDPRDIPMLVARIEAGADLVTGWRRDRKDVFLSRRVPSMIANWLISRASAVPIHDTGCSLKAYRAELIRCVPLYSDMHRFIPALSRLANARIEEVVVRHHPRRKGCSKYGISRIGKVLVDLMTIKMLISSSRRPLSWFGRGAAAAGLAAFLAGVWATSTVYRGFNPSVVPFSVACMFAYLSAHLLLAGIYAELIVHADRSTAIKPLARRLPLSPNSFTNGEPTEHDPIQHHPTECEPIEHDPNEYEPPGRDGHLAVSR
jgi:hypothetical protein